MMPMPMASPISRNLLVKSPTLNRDSRVVRQPKPLATWPATMAACVMVSGAAVDQVVRRWTGPSSSTSPQAQPLEMQHVEEPGHREHRLDGADEGDAAAAAARLMSRSLRGRGGRSITSPSGLLDPERQARQHVGAEVDGKHLHDGERQRNRAAREQVGDRRALPPAR